jgi:hypothetical protein
VKSTINDNGYSIFGEPAMSINSELLKHGAAICSGLDITTQDGIEAALLRGQDNDNTLLSVLVYLRQQAPITRRLTETVFADIASFFTDSPVQALAKLASQILYRRCGVAERDAIMSERDGDLSGLELGNTAGTQFVVFLRDVSVPDAVRYTNFDESGFFAHATFDTYADALTAAWDNGYRFNSAGALNRLCVTQSWSAGSKVTLLVQQVNLGKLSHQEFIEALAA